jgi:phosphate transport system substrate-binding protein
MSFGKSSLLTWILIALIPVGAGAGILIGWAVFSGEEAQTYSLNVEGSTTVYKIVADSHIAFMDAHPGVVVTVAGTGSGSGIGTLINGLADVAMASRPAKDTENDTGVESAFAVQGEYLRAFPIAKDGLAIIVNDDANALDMTIDQAKAIFNGTVDTWAGVDTMLGLTSGLTGDIQVVVREEGSGTRDAFNELVMGDEDQDDPDEQYAGDALQKNSNQLIFDEVNGNPNAIGYVGLGYVTTGVESVAIDGVAPSIATVVDGSYSVQRSLFLITLGWPTVGELIWEFINWHYSPDGQFYVEDNGFIAISIKRDDIT